MLAIDYLSAARCDFDESFDWYSERSVQAAARFTFAIDAALVKIAANPTGSTSLDGVLRELGKPIVIRGRLEKANLPRLDQVARKPDRDLQEYFIVRDGSWAPAPALLSLERASKSK